MSQLSLPLFLVVNYLANPMGVHDPAPRLGWQMAPVDGRRAIVQSAYEIKVSTRPDGPADLWDSGRVESDASTQIPYAGQRLRSRAKAYWQVTVWDGQGHAATSPAGAACWEAGLLERSDWSAQWIGAPWHGTDKDGSPAPYLRHTFALKGEPASARLYVTALGLYEAYLNGRRVGDDHFSPGWTDYTKRVQYQVYDVTPLVHSGPNVIGSILGDGWYAGHVAWKPRGLYGDRPRLFAQLEVTYPDGSREVVATDGTWQVASGPILENDLLMGETYDARRELAGWLGALPVRGDWQPATVFADPEIEISPMLDAPVRSEADIALVAAARPAGPGRFIYDFGQNLVGGVTLSVRAPSGTTVTLRYGEVLDDKGGVYTENLRAARATDQYTCRGAADGETWTPRFTYHGFRYAEVSGLSAGPGTQPPGLVAHVLHTEIAPAGDFACSEPLINQLQHNIQWSQRGNYFEVPTDCPQRDERLGWTGDAQAFIRTGAWNRDVAAFFTKWQRDIADAQTPEGAVPEVVPALDKPSNDGGPAWSDAAVICPWTIYLCYGDRALLAQHYDELTRYLHYTVTQSLDGIRLHPSLGKWSGFGDWLALDGSGHVDGGTPKDLIATAYFAYDAHLLAEMARILGRASDAAKYDALAAKVKAAFQRRFVTADGLVAGNTQTSYVVALQFDLVPAQLRPRLTNELLRDIHSRGDKLSTGFVGTPHLLHVLAREDHLDTAYKLLLQKDWPSWLYPVTQGATTIWERWDGWTREKGFEDKGMNSFNHYAYGAVGDWLYRVVAGVEIDPQKPAYKHVVLRPRPGGSLTSAKGTHSSPYGLIVSSWHLEAGAFVWDVVVPPNTTATAHFPLPQAATVAEGSKRLDQAEGVSNVRIEDGGTTCELGSGTYRFTSGL